MTLNMSLFGFGNKSANQAPATGTTVVQPQPAAAQVPVNGNGSAGPVAGQPQPANGQIQQPGTNPTNPLDPFLALMTPSKEVLEQKTLQQQQQTAGLFGGLTPEKMMEQVKKTNFTAGIDPALVQKALGGDQQAFMDVLNLSNQNAFAASLQMTQGMVEHGVTTGTDRFSSTLDSRFRDMQLRSKNSDNPALQHPIGQALLGTVKKQIAEANPRLSPDEIHAQGEKMFMQFAQLLTPQQQANGGSEQSEQTNWLKFLDLPQG